MKKKWGFLCGMLVGVVLVIGVGFVVRCEYASYQLHDVGPHYFINELARHIQFVECRMRVGLTKGDVRKIVGDSHNSDNENVWFWPSNYGKFVENNDTRLWRKYPNGLYVLFDNNGKTVFPGFRSTERFPLYDCGSDAEFSNLIGPYSDIKKMLKTEMMKGSSHQDKSGVPEL